MNTAARQQWLQQLAGSQLCSAATYQSWIAAFHAIENAEDAHAQRLIGRLVVQGVVLWQVAEEMHASAALQPGSAATQPAAALAGGGAVAAQLCSTLNSDLAGAHEYPADPAAAAPLLATLSGVALGALCARGGYATDVQAAETSAVTRLRDLVETVEHGYSAHADSAQFASTFAAGFEAWLEHHEQPSP